MARHGRRRHSCERKVAYSNGNEAQRAKRILISRGVQYTINVYRCKFCGHFHVGRGQFKKRRFR